MISPVQSCPTPLLDGDPASRILSGMKNLTRYVVIANDPESEFMSTYVLVSAHSPSEAKRCARGELARTKQDHFSIDLVLVAS